MNTKRTIAALLVALMLIVAGAAALAASGGGSTVRGRLVRQGKTGEYPASGIEVSLFAVSSKLGRSAKSFSGSDGMFYIRNVPVGNYRLELWVAKEPITYDIAVRGGEYTDIAPIVVH